MAEAALRFGRGLPACATPGSTGPAIPRRASCAAALSNRVPGAGQSKRLTCGFSCHARRRYRGCCSAGVGAFRDCGFYGRAPAAVHGGARWQESPHASRAAIRQVLVRRPGS
jgi:hypothetical protein